VKKANYRATETPGALTAAYRRGKALASVGGELQLNEAMNRCRTRDMANHLKLGYDNALAARYSEVAK